MRLLVLIGLFSCAVCASAAAQVRSSLKGLHLVTARVMVTGGGIFASGILDEPEFERAVLAHFTDGLQRRGLTVTTDVTRAPIAGCQVLLSRRSDAPVVLYRWDTVIMDRAIVERRGTRQPEYVMTWARNFLGSSPVDSVGGIAQIVGTSCAEALAGAWREDNAATGKVDVTIP